MPGEPDDLQFNDPYLEEARRKYQSGEDDPEQRYKLEDRANPYRHFQGYDARQWDEAQRADEYMATARQARADQAQQMMRQQAGMAHLSGLNAGQSRGSNPMAMRAAINASAGGGADAAIAGGQGALSADVASTQMGMGAWDRRMSALEEMEAAQLDNQRLRVDDVLGKAERAEQRRQQEEAADAKARNAAISAVMGAVGGGASAAGMAFSDERLKRRITELEMELERVRGGRRGA